MTRIFIKRAYEPCVSDDGFRVLVDKLWPRGMRKEMLAYDLWAKEIAPSDALRRWYHSDPENHWTEFHQKYAEELRRSPAFKNFVLQIADKPIVTLLYGARNAAENHALILQQQLQRALVGVVAEPING